MDFKPAVKLLSLLLLWLAFLYAAICSSVGAIICGGVYAPAGIANGLCWLFVICFVIVSSFKNAKK